MTDIQKPAAPGGTGLEETFQQAGFCGLGAGALVVIIGLLSAFGPPPWITTSRMPSLVFALVGSVPFFAAGTLLIVRRSLGAAGALNGLAWITIVGSFFVTIGGLIAVVLALGQVFIALPIAELAHSIHERLPSAGYLMITVLFFLCIVLIRLVRNVRRASSDVSGGGAWWIGIVLAWGYAVVAIPQLVKFSKSELEAWGQRQAVAGKNYGAEQAKVRQALRAMQRCLLVDKREHPATTFPDSATFAAGNSCVDSAKARKELADARVRYLPVPAEGGRNDGFWLVAEPTKAADWRGAYYADDQGMVYKVELLERDDSLYKGATTVPAAPLPLANTSGVHLMDTPAPALANIRWWIEQFRKDKSRYPVVIDSLYGVQIHFVTRGADGNLSLPAGDDRAGAYRLAYNPRVSPADSTRVLSFTMEARPATYGVDGIRGYFVDANGDMHWTRYDRAATVKDPLVSGCDLETSSCPTLRLTPGDTSAR